MEAFWGLLSRTGINCQTTDCVDKWPKKLIWKGFAGFKDYQFKFMKLSSVPISSLPLSVGGLFPPSYASHHLVTAETESPMDPTWFAPHFSRPLIDMHEDPLDLTMLSGQEQQDIASFRLALADARKKALIFAYGANPQAKDCPIGNYARQLQRLGFTPVVGTWLDQAMSLVQEVGGVYYIFGRRDADIKIPNELSSFNLTLWSLHISSALDKLSVQTDDLFEAANHQSLLEIISAAIFLGLDALAPHSWRSFEMMSAFGEGGLMLATLLTHASKERIIGRYLSIFDNVAKEIVLFCPDYEICLGATALRDFIELTTENFCRTSNIFENQIGPFVRWVRKEMGWDIDIQSAEGELKALIKEAGADHQKILGRWLISVATQSLGFEIVAAMREEIMAANRFVYFQGDMNPATLAQSLNIRGEEDLRTNRTAFPLGVVTTLPELMTNPNIRKVMNPFSSVIPKGVD